MSFVKTEVPMTVCITKKIPQANNYEILVSLCSYVKCQVDQVVLSLLPRPTKLPGKVHFNLEEICMSGAVGEGGEGEG